MPETESAGAPERPSSARFDEDPHTSWFLIQAGIERAFDYRRDIDETTARLIAHLVGPGSFSNLGLFAQAGRTGPHTTHEALRSEFIPIYHDPDTPDEIRELIDWLGAHLIHRDELSSRKIEQPPGAPKLRNLLWQTSVEIDGEPLTLHVRGDCPPDAIQVLPDGLTGFLDRTGDAGRAFLTLADVDAASPHLEESFHDAFRGSFPDQESALVGLAELEDIQLAIEKLASDFPGGKHVHLDRGALWHEVQEVFDIVWHGGEFHAFER